jgi:hypothetical protein
MTKTYADKEVISTSILRVRLAHLQRGFAVLVVMKGGRLNMQYGEQSFTARRIISLCKIGLQTKA